MDKCLLCYEGKCNKGCKKLDIERIMRAIRFDNIDGANYYIKGNPCIGCDEGCRRECINEIDIKSIIQDVIKNKKNIRYRKVDIHSEICGVRLENPFLLSSSVVGNNYEMCKRALERGWAGVVYKTISMMNIKETSPRFSVVKNEDNTFLGFKNIEQLSEHTVDENMEILRKLKEEFPNKVIIASIMGRDEEEWEILARKVEEAGVDVIELNFSCPNMEYEGTGSDVGQVPELVEKYTRASRRGSKLPILAKMTPNITDIVIPAKAAIEGGANGISAINTIKSITGINLDTLIPLPEVRDKSTLGGYSGRAVKPIGLRYIAELNKELECHLSGMGGVYTYKDAIEYMLLGARSIQVTTAVMEYGYRIIDDLILGLRLYMMEKLYNNLDDFIGLGSNKIVDSKELDRKTRLLPKFDKDKCIGCGRCYISCMDGGHQAIEFDLDKRKPRLLGSKCVGCHLCKLVCPNNAIGVVNRRINNMKKDKNLIVYFSATGVTRRVALELSKEIKSNILEIMPMNRYSKEDLDWTNSNSRSSLEIKDREFRPLIEDIDINIEDYDNIYMGYPIWWDVSPNIILTFLDKYKDKIKEVNIFYTSGGSKGDKSIEELSLKYKDILFKMMENEDEK